MILPDAVISRIEGHVFGIAAERERLAAARVHLKRGVLLYGPPGTGKTHTVRYLLARQPEVTALVLSGQALALVAQVRRVGSPASSSRHWRSWRTSTS